MLRPQLRGTGYDMVTHLVDDSGRCIALVRDPAYVNLLASAEALQQQLELALLILENVPGLRATTSQMHSVLNKSKEKY